MLYLFMCCACVGMHMWQHALVETTCTGSPGAPGSCELPGVLGRKPRASARAASACSCQAISSGPSQQFQPVLCKRWSWGNNHVTWAMLFPSYTKSHTKSSIGSGKAGGRGSGTCDPRAWEAEADDSRFWASLGCTERPCLRGQRRVGIFLVFEEITGSFLLWIKIHTRHTYTLSFPLLIWNNIASYPWM